MSPIPLRGAVLLALAWLLCLAPITTQSRALAADPPQEESKVTAANYKKLKAGMTVEEVQAILGPGKDLPASEFPEPKTRAQAKIKQLLESGGKGLKWEDGQKLIMVVFKSGRVAGTSGRNLGADN